ncbi:MAG: AMMECR1 domain-containing protein [Comamonadaceae bacterium CG1_02_60_18]|nr:MAG: AMMECR1 domain-containing protein [Comamonadaceae bacterium CG1_02_60_18]PIQ50508.1 MAG: AMMECR1 domain-containing protein [Comamonadaceae bacterium CG12_big_fil_rev_8_21_14_0_65_59_15]
MLHVRPAAVAGSFYPQQADALAHEVHDLLALARTQHPAQPSTMPKAVIVPHAGYIYSGSTAALAYQQLAAARQTIRRVVLLGPVHRVPVRGLALPGVVAFDTPLGRIAIDQVGVAALAGLPQVVVSAAAHAQEHSLEVQLPFLQSVLDDFTLLPLAVGDATPAQVAQVLDALWGGPETVIVISSDLSHFLPYANALQVDRASVSAMLALQPTLNHQQACGATPINGLLLAARQHHLQPHLLGLCNSGNTAGDKQRVVGYAALTFTAAAAVIADAEPQSRPPGDGGRIEPGMTTAPSYDTAGPAGGAAQPDPRGTVLLVLARAAISKALGQPAYVDDSAAWLREPGATFVTLTQNGALRGCIGSLQAHRPLLDDVQANAIAAALHDPRFAPLTAQELPATNVEVSLLSPLQPIGFASEADALAQLRPHVDGIVFSYQGWRSTFLPQVWEQLPDPHSFMAQLKRKAGLSANFWAPGVQLQRYTVAKYKEGGAQ